MTALVRSRPLGGGVGPPRAAFTLVEMLIVTSLITLLASAILFAMYGVLEDAKETRTRAQIVKLNELLLRQWESYRTRPAPIRIPPGTPPAAAARARLLAIRELMQMEMPDRKTDLQMLRYQNNQDNPSDPNDKKDYEPFQVFRLDALGNRVPLPTLWWTYYRRIRAQLGPNWRDIWTEEHEGAECLYLIVSAMREGDACALDFFRESEIGDADGDGMFEILDAWGRPIEFLRWAPGYATSPGPDGRWGVAGVDDDGNGIVDDIREMGWPGSDDCSEIQSRDATNSADPFDPLKVDPHWRDANPRNDPFALYPLVMSAGRDGVLDIKLGYAFPDGKPLSFHYVKTHDAACFGPPMTWPAQMPQGQPQPPWACDPYWALDPAFVQASKFWQMHSSAFSGNAQFVFPLGKPVDANGDGELGCTDNITNHLIEVK